MMMFLTLAFEERIRKAQRLLQEALDKNNHDKMEDVKEIFESLVIILAEVMEASTPQILIWFLGRFLSGLTLLYFSTLSVALCIYRYKTFF